MLKLRRVTKVKVFCLVLVYVFNFELFEFSAFRRRVHLQLVSSINTPATGAIISTSILKRPWPTSRRILPGTPMELTHLKVSGMIFAALFIFIKLSCSKYTFGRADRLSFYAGRTLQFFRLGSLLWWAFCWRVEATESFVPGKEQGTYRKSGECLIS